MQVSVENTGGLERRITVQVPAERVDQEVQSRLQSMSKTMRVDGFRPGKVPLSVVTKKYGKQVRLEVVDQVINSTLQEALTQENIRPAGTPDVAPEDAGPGAPLAYVATLEIYPEIQGSLDYTFKVDKPVVEVTDADVQNMLDKLLKQRATWNKVERAAGNDDQVIIDFEGSVNGESFSGNKASNMPLVLGSDSMIPGFEEQLIGISPGAEKTIEVTFPQDYASTEVAGKVAQFNIKAHSVSEMILPELNDEFAATFGMQDKGIDGLREEIASNMRRELQQMITSHLKQQVFGKLLENNDVDLPNNMIRSEIEELRSQEAFKDVGEAILEENAVRRLKLGVLVSEVVKQNQIQINADRVRETIESIAASYEKPEEVVQWYYGNQEMLAGVQSVVVEEQVMEWVLEKSGAEVEERVSSFDEMVGVAKKG